MNETYGINMWHMEVDPSVDGKVGIIWVRHFYISKGKSQIGNIVIDVCADTEEEALQLAVDFIQKCQNGSK